MKSLSVSYKNLSISPKNARVVMATKEADKQLIESIRYLGLLQKMIVIPAAKQGDYEVIAGGRRFASIGVLIAEGAEGFTPKTEFVVELADAEQAIEMDR